MAEAVLYEHYGHNLFDDSSDLKQLAAALHLQPQIYLLSSHIYLQHLSKVFINASVISIVPVTKT